MSIAALLDRALCAWWDWMGWMEDEHPTALGVGMLVAIIAGYTFAGTLE